MINFNFFKSAREFTKITRLVRAYSLLFSRRETEPVIIYQMGKVGSSSIRDSLKLNGIRCVYHIHRMFPENIKKVRDNYLENNQLPPTVDSVGLFLYNHIIRKEKKAKFITLIREPIGRNVSAFFENYRRFTGKTYNDSDISPQDLINIFLKNYPHQIPLTWFDNEMKKALNIDVYNYNFPRKTGYLNIKERNFDILILKLELDDIHKGKAISEFLNYDSIELVRSNVGGKKVYSDTYRNFKKEIRFPDSYVDKICNSKYMRHFYSDEEIEQIKSKWTLN